MCELTHEQERQVTEQLEAIVDKASLAEVVRLLSVICHEKAAHIEGTWQDNKLANSWRKYARTLETAESKL